MTQNPVFLFLFFLTFVFSSCATTHSSGKASSVSDRKEAQTAVGTIANTIKGESVGAKYCPVCGRHFSASVQTCTKDGTLLKEVQE